MSRCVADLQPSPCNLQLKGTDVGPMDEPTTTMKVDSSQTTSTIRSFPLPFLADSFYGMLVDCPCHTFAGLASNVPPDLRFAML
jgi:hypothetical protein